MAEIKVIIQSPSEMSLRGACSCDAAVSLTVPEIASAIKLPRKNMPTSPNALRWDIVNKP